MVGSIDRDAGRQLPQDAVAQANVVVQAESSSYAPMAL
jgi:hypothetical protein